jgi:fructosamine-3-kinase
VASFDLKPRPAITLYVYEAYDGCVTSTFVGGGDASFWRPFCQIHQAPGGSGFGFERQTYYYNVPQYFLWEKTWSVFFSKSLVYALDKCMERRGSNSLPDRELLKSLRDLCEKKLDPIIERILQPLDAEVTPTLVHGNLGRGTVGSTESAQPVLLQPPAMFYAHHEYELGRLWMDTNDGDIVAIEAFIQGLGMVRLTDEIKDRVRLYSIRFLVQEATRADDLPARTGYLTRAFDVLDGL